MEAIPGRWAQNGDMKDYFKIYGKQQNGWYQGPTTKCLTARYLYL